MEIKTRRCIHCGAKFPAHYSICSKCLKNQLDPSNLPADLPPKKESAAKPLPGKAGEGSSFAGTSEVIWLLVVGIATGAMFIRSLVVDASSVVVWATGVLAGVFALPFALIVVAVILAVIVQIFSPGGGNAIPLFAWKGGVDGLSATQRLDFRAKPPVARFARVYLYLAVNSLVGAAITLVAFAGLYVLMQFAQQPHPH